MILSDKTILALMSAGQLGIEPVTPEQIQPASVDIRLGNTFSYFSSDNPDVPLSMSSQPTYTTVTCERFVGAPKQFVLATTMEYFRVPDNLTAFVEGRSSIGRL